MRYLFLDDERIPTDVTWITLHEGDWDIVRSFEEFKAYIDEHGCPDVISFDNDLGHPHFEGRHCAQYLAEKWYLDELNFPADFQFTVHSKNNIAAEWIQQYLTKFVDFTRGE